MLAAPMGRGGCGMDPDGEAKWKERWLARVGVVVKARRGFWIGDEPEEEETGGVAAAWGGWDSLPKI